MAHLVGQGKLAVQIVLVVQQDIGVGTAVAGGVGAAALADVLVHVDPAVAEALLQQGHIVVTQHLQGLQHGLLGLLIGDGLVGVGHDGGVHIVHMQLVHAQQLLAQGNVAVHLVQVVVNGLDEVHVHRHGDLGGVQGGLDGTVVMAGVGKEAQLLELTVQGGSNGVLILAQLLVIGLEGPAAQLPVGAGQQGHKGGVRQGMDAALAVGDVGEIWSALRKRRQCSQKRWPFHRRRPADAPRQGRECGPCGGGSGTGCGDTSPAPAPVRRTRSGSPREWP